jgi:hypothetical protein
VRKATEVLPAIVVASGEDVVVTTPAGETRGRLLDLSPASLAVVLAGTRDTQRMSVLIAGIAGAGVGIGAAIDRSIEQTVYALPAPPPRVTVRPAFGGHKPGFGAAIRF